jgi:periplasmic protein TonB
VGKLVATRKDVYPRLARDRRWEGTVRVRVVIGRNGVLKGIVVSDSTGYQILDERALELVKDALPPVPKELRDHEFSIALPVVFRLKDGQ